MRTVVSGVVGVCLFVAVLGAELECTLPSDSKFKNESKACMRHDYPTVLKDGDGNCTHWPSANATEVTDFLLYVLLDSLPVLILVPLILFFNINLASGLGHSLVFTYQVLVAVFHITPNVTDKCGFVTIFGVLFNAPLQLNFTLFPNITITHYALGYVKIPIAGVMVVLYLILATCSQCPVQCCRSCWAQLRRSVRNWRESHLPQRPVFTGACSVAILMYGSLVEVSFQLLFRCDLIDEVCPNLSTHYNYSFECHIHAYTVSSQPLCWVFSDRLPYFIPACILIGIAVLLSLPFFYHPGVPALVSYLTRGRVQLPRLHRVRPIFDLFQGVYKPKMQFFTGLHLLYRIILWSAVAFPSNNAKIFLFMFFWLVILGIHSLFQPFENRKHNYLEALLMVNVALAAASYGSYFYNLSSYQDSPWREILFTVPVVFANLPLACVIVYYLWKIFRRFRCCCLRKRQKFLIGEEDSFRGDRWVPPYNGPFPN